MESIKNDEVRNQIDDLTPGCFVLVIEMPGSNMVEALTLHKQKEGVSTMIAKENIYSLQMRHLNREEREFARTQFESGKNNRGE